MKVLPVFDFEDTLSEEHHAFFRQYGVIHFRNFVQKETVIFFLTELHRIEKSWLETDTTVVNGVPLKFGQDENGEPTVQRGAFMSQHSDILREFLQDPRLQELTELLAPYPGRIGENEKDGLVFNHYVNQPNSSFSQMGWHTDAPRDLFLGQKIMPMLNVGLHLDDCPFENGGLRVIPGTQYQTTWQLLFGKKYFIDNSVDPREVGVNTEAGDLTIHDGRLWHRVQQSPNYGEKSRRRVMYIPIITGKVKIKSENSRVPFYHRLAKLMPK